MSSSHYKQQGNDCFKKRNFEEAIKYYSLAIQYSKNNSVLYTNKSLCYLKLNKFQNALIDANLAIEIDHKSIKGYHYKGRAYYMLSNFVNSEECFKKGTFFNKFTFKN